MYNVLGHYAKLKERRNALNKAMRFGKKIIEL